MSGNTRKKIVITRRWPEAVEQALVHDYDVQLNDSDVALSMSQMRRAFVEADAVLTTVTDKISAELMTLPNRRVGIVGNFGVGFNHIDIEAAKAAGVVVSNTPDVLSECTADLALTLMLMACRRAGEGERELRAGHWTGWRPTHLVGARLSGKTLGIIGYGRIGQETARRAHHGFGMPVIAHNRSAIAAQTLAQSNVTQVESIEQLLQQADIVSLHCPSTPETHHLINGKRLELMKPDAFLINTARGDVVDEAALADALANGTIRGAGLDVFEQEPAVHASLLGLDNVVLLPHLGSATDDTREAMGFRVKQNLDAYFAKQAVPDQVV